MKIAKEEYKYYGIKFEEYVPNIETNKCVCVPNFWLSHRKPDFTALVAYPNHEPLTCIQLRVEKRSNILRSWKHFNAKAIFGADSFEEATSKCKMHNESKTTEIENQDKRLEASLKIKTRHPQKSTNFSSKANMIKKEPKLKTATKRTAQTELGIETNTSKASKKAKIFLETCTQGKSNAVSSSEQNLSPKDLAGTSQSSIQISPNLVNQYSDPRTNSESREQAFCNALFVKFNELQVKFVNTRQMYDNLLVSYSKSLEEIKTLIALINDLRNNIPASPSSTDAITSGDDSCDDDDNNADRDSNNKRGPTHDDSIHNLSNNISVSPTSKDATTTLEVPQRLTEQEQINKQAESEEDPCVVSYDDDDNNADRDSNKKHGRTHDDSIHNLINNISASSTSNDATVTAELKQIFTEEKQIGKEVDQETINIISDDDDSNVDEDSNKERDQTNLTHDQLLQILSSNMSTSPASKDATAAAVVEQKVSEQEKTSKEVESAEGPCIAVDNQDDNNDDEDLNKENDQTCNSPSVAPPEYDPNDLKSSLKYSECTPGLGLVALRPHNNEYSVYLKETVLKKCLQSAKNCYSLTENLLKEVFTEEALEFEALNGNGLHKLALDDVLTFIQEYADSRKWYELDKQQRKRYY